MRTRTGSTLHIDMGSMAQMKSSCLHVEPGIKTIVILLQVTEALVHEIALYSLATNSLVDKLVVENGTIVIDWKSLQGIGYNLHMPGRRNLKLFSAGNVPK